MTMTIQIELQLIGQPQEHHDNKGSWRTSIYRNPITEPLKLSLDGLAGDQVTDTVNHGSSNQAVCCHPMEHYEHWNDFYGLSGKRAILPGSIGENWTLRGTNEHQTCVGDVYRVGSATVQVSAPRYPCSKQERRVGIKGFTEQVQDERRTGWYLRVLEPGEVKVGDSLTLIEQPCPFLSIDRVSSSLLGEFDEGFARQLLSEPFLAAGWKEMVAKKLNVANRI